MKDFEIRVKNLSTHRFPLGTDPAKECFILNVAAHKHFTAVPGFRRLPLDSIKTPGGGWGWEKW